jgi:hypothetical protein
LEELKSNTSHLASVCVLIIVKMETETILWSKHVKILVILNLKLILAILLHQRPLVCNHRTLQNSKSSSL